MTTPVPAETHPVGLLTIKLYAPACRPETVVVVPVPETVIVSGVLVNVQVPVAGSPLSTTIPVETLQVGCVMVPIIGVAGLPG